MSQPFQSIFSARSQADSELAMVLAAENKNLEDYEDEEMSPVFQGMKPMNYPPKENLEEPEFSTFWANIPPYINSPLNAHVSSFNDDSEREYEDEMDVFPNQQHQSNNIFVPIQYNVPTTTQNRIEAQTNPERYMVVNNTAYPISNYRMSMQPRTITNTQIPVFNIQITNIIPPWTNMNIPSFANHQNIRFPPINSRACQTINPRQTRNNNRVTTQIQSQTQSQSQPLRRRKRGGGRKPGVKSSKYRGVSRHKGTKKWFTTITYHHKQYYLGLYHDETHAARAYDVYARKLHGINARTNLDFVNDTEDIINVVKIY